MADGKTVLEVEVNQTGNAAEGLEKVADAADKAAESQKKVKSAAEEANKELDKSGQRGGSSTADKEGAGIIGALRGMIQGMAQRGSGSVAQKAGTALGGEGEKDSLFGKMGMVGGGAAAVVGGYMALTQAAKSAAESINVLNNASLTGAQQTRALTEQYIPGAKSLREFMEAVSGVTESLRQNELFFADLNNQMSLQFSASMKMLGYDKQLIEAEASDKATSGPGAAQYANYRTFDRSTVSGQQSYQDNAIRQQAEDNLVRAQRRRDAAVGTRDRMIGDYDGISARASESANARDRMGTIEGTGPGGLLKFNQGSQLRGLYDMQSRGAGMQAGGGLGGLGFAMNPFMFAGELAGRQAFGSPSRMKAETDTGLRSFGAQGQEALNDAKKQEQALLNLKEAQVKAAQAESDVRKAQIEQLKAESQILQQREQRMSEGQKRLGGMSQGELIMSEEIMDQIKKEGIEAATPEMIQIARQIAPREIDKMLEGKGGAIAQRLAGKGYQDYEQDYDGGKKSLSDVRGQLDKVQAEVRVNIDLDEKSLAKEIAAALGPVISQLKDLSAEIAKRESQQQQIGRQIQFNLNF